MFFCFCIFLVDQRKYKKSDPRAGTQERLNKRQPKLQTTCPQSQTRAPMGSAVLFFDFQGFCVVCSGWPEPRKSKQKQKKQYCRPHVHRVRQEPQWGLQFCFFDFQGFCMVCSRWSEPRKSKKTKKTKLQTTCPQSQTRASMGSAVFCFCF